MGKRSVIFGLLTCLMVAACSEQKNLHEMHDATVEMNKTTDQMNKRTDNLATTTSRMEEKTGQLLQSTTEMNDRTQALLETSQTLENTSGQLRDTTDELYDALRQGNALQLRRDAYDSVLKAPNLFKKVSEAAKYFMSFEFQLWNQFAQDKTEDKRYTLAQQAAQEFYMEIESLANRDGKINPKATAETDNKDASFNAMALAMHQMNRKQAANIGDQSQFPPMNLLSLTEEALLAKNRINAGEDMGAKAGFMREILAHEPKAIQLLQARYNLFPLVFIDTISHIQDESWLVKAKMALIGWDCNLDTLNLSQVQYLQKEVLAQALEAREMLKKIGVKPKMDWAVTMLLKNMRTKADKTQMTPQLATEKNQLVGLIADLKKGL